MNGSEVQRVLFVTSNGAGMGHLTRCLAIAMKGKPRFQSAFLSLAKQSDVVKKAGFDVLTPMGKDELGVDWQEWHHYFSKIVDSALRHNSVDTVVFDGTWVYRGITQACRRHGVELIWLRRGLWKGGRDCSQLASPMSHVDKIIEPADVGHDIDNLGPMLNVYERNVPMMVSPITIGDSSVLASRNELLRELDLDPAFSYVLIQLGAGTINDIKDIRQRAIETVTGLGKQWRAVVAFSPLSSPSLQHPPGAVSIRVYPLARFLKVFEFGVFAAGYNSIHEALVHRLPCVLVPNYQTSTDDQVRRAQGMNQKGLGLMAADVTELERAIHALSDLETRDLIKMRLSELKIGDGAAEAIDIIAMSR